MRPSRHGIAPKRILTEARPMRRQSFSVSTSRALAADARPSSAPKPVIDIKHIRLNAAVHEANCRSRRYEAQAAYPARIAALHAKRVDAEQRARGLRERAKELGQKLKLKKAGDDTADGAVHKHHSNHAAVLDEARAVKQQLSQLTGEADAAAAQMETLALQMPNLTSSDAPPGPDAAVLGYINDAAATSIQDKTASHVDIGTRLGILDFAAAATSSGWGWYYLLGAGARLEQALVQYALTLASRRGFTPVSPPTAIYTHMAAACGFHPRDHHGETQIYTLTQTAADVARRVPPLCLAGTAEIPLAALNANAVIEPSSLPIRRAAVSRCFRAEAGARGALTKGLYRVHEFTKVEMFGWCAPDTAAARAMLDDMVHVQRELLQSLGLYCRILAMPPADLGASAAYKIDIEAMFPSRRRSRPSSPATTDSSPTKDSSPPQLANQTNAGWGEVTSASICTDYQTRRLATRLRASPSPGSSLGFPYTANATALAVPRVLAALLETGWDEASRTVAIPECLRPWMDGQDRISASAS